MGASEICADAIGAGVVDELALLSMVGEGVDAASSAMGARVVGACVVFVDAIGANVGVAEEVLMGDVVGLEVVSRSAHIFVPSLLPGGSTQCAPNPAQLSAHFAIIQVESSSSSSSHSSKGSVLDAA